jgi:UDP-glucose:glycoprotein glucosyltransferase
VLQFVSELTSRKVKELPFGHVYNPSALAEVAVLYADIQADTFNDFHSILKKLADEGIVQYILRYRPATNSATLSLKDKPLFVAGYGVELMLKRTDYIVIDDREVETGNHSTTLTYLDNSEKSAKPKSEDSNEEIPVITPLHTSELSQLGYQAVQLITTASSPLDTLQHLSQDFPSQSSKIAAVEVDDDLVDILRENNLIIPGGENMFWMNGIHIARDKVEAFNLLSVMRRERSLVTSLRKLGLTNHEAVMFLSHPTIAAKIEVGTKNRFDIRDDSEGGNVVIWLNDLEKDTRYRAWPTDIRNVLRFHFPAN